MPNTRMEKELWVTTSNEIGTLAKVCAPISEARVNIWGVCAWGEKDRGYFRLFTDDNQKALTALKTAGFTAEEREAVTTELENKPGTCFHAVQKLAQAGVNINYWYYTACGNCTTGKIVFSTNNNQKALEVLR